MCVLIVEVASAWFRASDVGALGRQRRWQTNRVDMKMLFIAVHAHAAAAAGWAAGLWRAHTFPAWVCGNGSGRAVPWVRSGESVFVWGIRIPCLRAVLLHWVSQWNVNGFVRREYLGMS